MHPIANQQVFSTLDAIAVEGANDSRRVKIRNPCGWQQPASLIADSSHFLVPLFDSGKTPRRLSFETKLEGGKSDRCGFHHLFFGTSFARTVHVILEEHDGNPPRSA